MSWLFDEVNDAVTLADHAALTFPDADWTVAGWVKLTDNVGTAYQYFLSWNAFNATNSWHWYIGEAASTIASTRDRLLFAAQSSNGTAWANGGDQPSTAAVGASTAWQHLTIRYTKATKTLDYSINGVADRSWVVSGATSAIDHSGALYFGSRATSPTDRYFGGRLAEFAKWDRRLSNAEVSALASGDAPSLVGDALTWYCPMTDLSESVQGIAVTASGGAAVDGDHPSINYGSSAHQITIGSSQATTTSSGLTINTTVLVSVSGSEVVSAASSAAVLGGGPVGVDAASSVCANSAGVASVLQTTLISSSDSSQSAQASSVTIAPLITITSPQDRGTLDLANCSVTPNGSTPIVAVKNQWFSDNSGGARFCYFRVDGVNGLAPIFDVDKSNMEIAGYSAKFKWSYSGIAGSWVDFDSTTTLTGPARIRASNVAAFNQNSVFVALNYPWPPSYTLPWIESLESSGFVSEALSSSGNDYVFHVRSATTNGSTAGAGDVVPAQPLYSFKISSGGLAPDGAPKRKMVLSSGTHASEDVGNYALKGAVEFLVSADAQAILIRDWFDVYVYPVISSAGRAGGATRTDFEDAYKTADSNRAWHLSTIETLVAHKAAIAIDAGNEVDVYIDFHGDTFGGAWYDSFYNASGSRAAEKAKWISAISNYRSVSVSDWNTSGSSANWFAEIKSTKYAMLPEGQYWAAYTPDYAAVFGADHMRAVAYLAAADEFGTAGTNAVATGGAGIGASAGSGGDAVGQVAGAASGGTGASFGSGSGGDASGEISVTASGGTGTGASSGSGGDAVGEAGGSATAPGGTGISNGSGSGGVAVGEVSAVADGGTGTGPGAGGGGSAIGTSADAVAAGGVGAGAGSGAGGDATNTPINGLGAYITAGVLRVTTIYQEARHG